MLFGDLHENSDITSAFFGHDHMNDFTCVVDGITMGQCKTAGFRTIRTDAEAV